MKLTNKKNLPQAIYDAISADPYSKGDADFSITELLKPPRIRALEKKHTDDLTEDVSDRLWSLYGQIAHLILERANRKDLAEKRLFTKIDGYKISGQFDTLDLDDGVLSDYKLTTSYAFMGGREPKPEWVAQLNMQLFLLREHNLNAKKLQIVGLLRDWQIREAGKSLRYPQEPISIVSIPIWSKADTFSFIKQRIKLHVDAAAVLPICDNEETWNGRRCLDYCAVGKAGYCEQYNNELKGE